MSRFPARRSVRALLSQGLSSLRRLLSPAERPGRAAQRRPSRLGLEVLEDRTLPAIALSPVAITAVEGRPFSGTVATFTEPGGLLADFSATINYGDGTPSVTVTSTPSANGQIIADPSVSGQFDVVGKHTFPAGNFNIQVTVTDTVTSAAATTAAYDQANLVTDNPTFLATLGQPAAAHTDPNLVNPWGIAASPAGSPWWVANNGTGTATLYDSTGLPQPQPTPLVVTIPVSSNTGHTSPAPVTGIVFNGTTSFNVAGAGTPAHFIFATEDGTIAAWNSGATAVLKVDNADFTTGPVFKGLALGNNGAGNFLYATDFRTGTIDVYDTNFAKVTLGTGGFGNFTDPTPGANALPAGFAPFGIQNINNQLYVTYALQDATKHDDVPGAGNGFVDVYDLSGNFVKRLASGGTLNSPWGLALAPSSFGVFGGDLLVGNFGDGRINAFNPSTGAFLGQVNGPNNAPITIPNLWGLSFGNNGTAGSANTLFFAAGIGGETHGLFGSLTAVSPSTALVRVVPQIVYVSPSFTGPAGSDPDGSGPATAIGYDAFATIQAGLNAVATGGKVVVEAGTYHEVLTVSRPVFIQGAGAGSAILSGQGEPRGVPGVNVNSSGAVAISGLTVSGFTAGLIAGSATPYLALLDVRFSGNEFGSFLGGVKVVLITGGTGNDLFFASPVAVDRQGDDPIFYENVPALTVDGGGGTNELLVFLNETTASTITWVTAFGISRTGTGATPFLLFYTDTGGTFGGGVTAYLGASQTAVVQSQLGGVPTNVVGLGGNNNVTVVVTNTSNYLNLSVFGVSGTNALFVQDASGGGSAVNFETPQGVGNFVVHYSGGTPSGSTSQIFYLDMASIQSNLAFVTIPTTLM